MFISCMDVLLTGKLRTTGLQFHMLPRRKAARAAKSKAPAQDCNDSKSIDSIMHVQDCAPRLQAVAGVGPKVVQALLDFAATPRSAALVEGLLHHIRLTSQSSQTTSPQPDIGRFSPVVVNSADSANSAEAGLVVRSAAKTTQTGEGTARDIAAAVAAAAAVVSAESSPSPSWGAPSESSTEQAADPALASLLSLLPLAGRVVVFTGKLESGMSRATAQALCEELGMSLQSVCLLVLHVIRCFSGIVVKGSNYFLYFIYFIRCITGGKTRSSINKSVNLVIQARDAENSSKHALAVKNGVEIWSEEEWNAFLVQHGEM